MRFMPFALAALLAAGAATATTHKYHATKAPDTCARATEQDAFDTEGLKSELMVTALACHEQDKYNAFMSQYQPAVASSEKDIAAYFKRVYGRQGTKEYDDYISNLANEQSRTSMHAGSAYCGEYDEMFDEVMSLHDATELADYSHSQAIVQPVKLSTCADLPAASVKSHARRHKKA